MNKAVRSIFSDNSILIDYSIILNDFMSFSAIIPYTVSQDYIYLSSRLPFNHFFFDVSTANDVTSSINVEFWFGNEWVQAIDIIDETSVSGKSWAQSGIVSWTTDNFKGWDKYSRGDVDPGIGSLKIYDQYWVRLTFNATLKITTALAFIGHKFADDSDFYLYYPDLNNSVLKNAYKSGKTTWNEQHFASAQKIEKDLITKNVILDRAQIFNPYLFKEASIYKSAEIIYSGLGKDYVANSERSRAKYYAALNLKQFRIDSNADGREDFYDNFSRQSGLYR